MKSAKAIVILCTALLLTGCGADSLLPWLDVKWLVPCNRAWLGEWYVNEDGGQRELRLVVELREKTTVLDGKETIPEKYRISVYDQEGGRRPSLTAHLYSVNGVQLLQIQDFNRPVSDEITSVSTYSLWRIEGNSENLMLWEPEFVKDMLKNRIEPPVKMVRAGHEHEQPVFTDTTTNLQSYVEQWSTTYQESRTKMAVGLHRKGKAFEIPEGVKKRKQPNQASDATSEPAPGAGSSSHQR
jgi:hypothetical protein